MTNILHDPAINNLPSETLSPEIQRLVNKEKIYFGMRGVGPSIPIGIFNKIRLKTLGSQ